MNKLNYLKNISIFMIALVISLPFIFANEQNLITDANGNLVTGDGFYREYNEFNQLVKVYNGTSADPTQLLQEYMWHPIEERVIVKKSFENGVLNQTIFYVNDNYIAIRNNSGLHTEKYIYQDGKLAVQKDANGDKQSIHTDHLGSTSLLADSNGDTVENTLYSPFAEIIEGGTNSRFTYENKEHDEKTGDYDYKARNYKAEWGKFLKPDTWIKNYFMPQTLNRFAFELNNPFRFVDPDGKDVEEFEVIGINPHKVIIIYNEAGAVVYSYYSTDFTRALTGARTSAGIARFPQNGFAGSREAAISQYTTEKGEKLRSVRLTSTSPTTDALTVERANTLSNSITSINYGITSSTLASFSPNILGKFLQRQDACGVTMSCLEFNNYLITFAQQTERQADNAKNKGRGGGGGGKGSGGGSSGGVPSGDGDGACYLACYAPPPKPKQKPLPCDRSIASCL